ncbi:AfsR/SARP family transcriptional regulator [Longimicrobium sp.]|uniref:AfsR/SARP family transcriptional regulator n=1 Tax=Longimicrobium sp. TaxID=2029185 RepID=UPI003B3A908B
MYLRTLGHPVLVSSDGGTVGSLRTKDLALLVYLCVEGAEVQARGRLATLLWGENTEEAARHSLTQALRRIRAVLPGSLRSGNQVVHWAAALPCDAVELLRGDVDPARVDESFPLYGGEFLAGFDAGSGAEGFAEWAEGRRPVIRQAALRRLEAAWTDAAARRDWPRALRLAERAVEIDPIAETARRGVMSALAGSGERNRALRYYETFTEWLDREMVAEPDPDTRALAEQLRAEAADPPPAPPPRTIRASPAPPAAPPPPPADPPREADGGPIASTQLGAGLDPPDAPAQAAPVQPSKAAPRLNRLVSAPTPGGDRKRRPGMVSGAVLMAALVGLGIWMSDGQRLPAEAVQHAEQLGHGETVRVAGEDRLYLAFGEMLYAYPDSATLLACTGHQPHAVRELSRLPDWPRATLPSVRQHPWLRGPGPIVTDHPENKPAFVVIGCILSPVPDPATLDSIFGAGALERMTEVPDSVLLRMPRVFAARGHPVRPPGTLIRSPGGGIQWITYHGGALAVPDSTVLATYCRAPSHAVPVSDGEFRYYHPFGNLHPARTECRGAG